MSCGRPSTKKSKERICKDTWKNIAAMRTISRPAVCSHAFTNVKLTDSSRAIHSSATKKLMKKGARAGKTTKPLDPSLAATRISGGASTSDTGCTPGPKYADTLPAMLPRSSACVFTHADADIAPRNTLVDEQLLRISAILGWESAGWYPHYREYANIMGPAGKVWRLTVVYGIERRR